ncbi:antitoxin [Georgenia sp. SUBG003]|uniref:antitoxin n=1 Tax=Georgenia sp. SUBG003 TaxID=1497974 RepID=UPI003AB2F5C8
MGLDDLARKAKEAWQHEKVQNALRSEKAESVSDSVLDRAAGAADRVTGGRYTDQVAGAREAADARIGTPARADVTGGRRRGRRRPR